MTRRKPLDAAERQHIAADIITMNLRANDEVVTLRDDCQDDALLEKLHRAAVTREIARQNRRTAHVRTGCELELDPTENPGAAPTAQGTAYESEAPDAQ